MEQPGSSSYLYDLSSAPPESPARPERRETLASLLLNSKV